MKCPHDGTRLVPRRHEGHVAYNCSACEGAWLTRPLLAALCRVEAIPEAVLFTRLRQRGRASHRIACPRCALRTVTTVIRSPRLARNLELDFCPGCEGVWFDPREVQRLVGAIGRRDEILRDQNDEVEPIDIAQAILTTLLFIALAMAASR